MVQYFIRKLYKIKYWPTVKLSSLEKSSTRIVDIKKVDKVINVDCMQGISWSYVGSNINNIVHALNGNRKIGYKVAVWNCRRGLLNFDGTPSSKITEIKLYIQKHQLDVFGILESDLNGVGSRINRSRPLSTSDVHHSLHVDGYYILLPQSWHTHGQARIFVYIREGIQIKERKLYSCLLPKPANAYDTIFK